jgi:hypothetical protein
MRYINLYNNALYMNFSIVLLGGGGDFAQSPQASGHEIFYLIPFQLAILSRKKTRNV